MGNAPRTSFLARSGLLGLMVLPLAALSLWSVRLIPQAIHAHAAIHHCETWVSGLDQFQEAFVRLEERGYAMHHGGPFGVEQATTQEVVDAYWRARNLLAERTHQEQDPRLATLDQSMTFYLAQLDRVSAATRVDLEPRGPSKSGEAEAGLSLELAHLSHRFKDVDAAFRDLENFHQRLLEDAIHGMESHTGEMTAFAFASLLLAFAFILAGLQFLRLKRRVEDSARFAQAQFEAAPIGLLVWDVRNVIRQSNSCLADMFDRSATSLEDAPLSSVIPESVAGALNEADPRHAVAFNLHRPDGTYAAFEAGVATTTIGDRPYRIAAVWDISRRVQAERRLKLRERHAELGERASGAVRDLERLLHPLLLAVDLLKLGGNTREKVEDLHELIERNGKAAASLAGQLSHLVHASEEALQPAIFELNACVWEAVAGLDVAPGLQLDLQISDGALLVRGQRGDFLEALQILLQRGAEAAGERGRLRVTTREQDAFRVAEISDTGTAIPPEAIGTIFSTSYLATRRADGPDLSRLPGLLQGMGGDIRIGRGPSGETMFTLLLPIAEA